MISAFDHPWLGGLFADPKLAAIWSPDAQLRNMLAFESAWSRHGYLAGLWSEADGAAAADAIAKVEITPIDLAEGTVRDGVCVPDLVKALKSQTGLSAVHTGATSQDVIDSATVISISATLDHLITRIEALKMQMIALDSQFGDMPMMGRTRMQAAVPITVRDRLESWMLPLADHLDRITELRPRVTRVQVGGAAGNRAKTTPEMVSAVAAELGLLDNPKAWHAMRDGVGEFASVLSLISGTLGKIGQDVCLMAQQGIDEIALAGGGGSSAMPHKQNPVLAELLVTLARFNAVQLSGMHQALVHEQERSGAAWALEWMILPQMVQATGRGLTAASELTDQITRIGQS